MRFRLPWKLVILYVATATALFLTAGPLSQFYFRQPLIGLNFHGAVPVQGPGMPGTTSPYDPGNQPSIPQTGHSLRGFLAQIVSGPLFGLETLKGFLRVAVPGMAAAEAKSGSFSNPIEGITVQQAILRGFEVAGGVELGRPWTLLAAELPAMHFVELSEPGPLVVAIETVLPQWQYEELLAAGSRGVEPSSDGSGEAGPSEPLVAIYHTHGTEAFLGTAAVEAGVNPDIIGFSTDPERNIMRVGAELAGVLQNAGIGVIHITETFDYENQLVTRTGAYVRSLQRLEDFKDGRPLLEVHPSIRLIIDLHRDAVDRDKVVLQTLDGQTAARILMVVGSRGNPHWETNHCFARQLHNLLEESQPGISRGVMVRHDARFNQHLLPGSLLIEVGSVENTLAEALVSARLLGSVIREAFARNIVPVAGAPYSCPF